MEKIRRKVEAGRKICILDLASGKGGDQRKWKIAKVNKVVHAGNLILIIHLGDNQFFFSAYATHWC